MLQTIDLYVTDQWFVANKLMVYIVKSYGLSIQNEMLLAYNLPYRSVVVSHQVDTFAFGRYAGAREGIVNTVIWFSHRSWTNTSLLVSQRDDFLELGPITMVAVQHH